MDKYQEKRASAIDRRQTILLGTSAGLSWLLRSAESKAESSDQTQKIQSTAIAPRPPQRPLDFELFFDLSRYITARADLKRSTAMLHFPYFAKEEWGWFIAGNLYSRFADELSQGIPSIPHLMGSGKLSQLDQWYAQHILDSWYEGFYRYEGREVRVTYVEALMWKAVEGFLPIQGHSDLPYGFWADAPARGSDK